MSRIKLKRSLVGGSIPTTSDLVSGELAVNVVDGKLFFKKTVSAVDSIITIEPLPTPGLTGNVLTSNGSAWISQVSTGGGGGGINYTASSTPPVSPSLGDQWYDTSSDILYTRITDGVNYLWLDISSVPSTFGDITANGNISVSGTSTLTGNVSALANFSITGNLTVNGSTYANSPIKTYNLLGDFSAPVIGTTTFVPIANQFIKTVLLTNGTVVGSDLVVGLYKNNQLINFFTLPAGNFTKTISNLNYYITTADYITVRIVSGSGRNFTMQLFNY